MEFLFYHCKDGKSHAFRRVAKFDAVVSLHTVIARRSFSETPYHIIGFSPDTIDRWFFYFHTLSFVSSLFDTYFLAFTSVLPCFHRNTEAILTSTRSIFYFFILFLFLYSLFHFPPLLLVLINRSNYSFLDICHRIWSEIFKTTVFLDLFCYLLSDTESFFRISGFHRNVPRTGSFDRKEIFFRTAWTTTFPRFHSRDRVV